MRCMIEKGTIFPEMFVNNSGLSTTSTKKVRFRTRDIQVRDMV